MLITFIAGLIAVYPIILFISKDKFFKLIFLSSPLAFPMFYFWMFFISPVRQDNFRACHTIFSDPM